MSSMDSLRTLFPCLAPVLVLFTFSEGREQLVGGQENSWKVPQSPDDFNKWAGKRRFLIGDSLVEKWLWWKHGMLLKEGAMEDPRSVNSPRRVLSLSRKSRGTLSFPEPDDNKASGFGVSRDHGPNPSEVYGFVGAISTVVATVIFLIWAYLPEPWLHFIEIYYYPSSALGFGSANLRNGDDSISHWFYIGLNFVVTPPPTSLNTIFDEYSREPLSFDEPSMKGDEQPIEPISDIGINLINDLIYASCEKSESSDMASNGGIGEQLPWDLGRSKLSSFEGSDCSRIPSQMRPVVLEYDPKSVSVLEVTEEDYKNCNMAKPIKAYNDSNTKIVLDHSGLFYFISGAEGHCEKGQKLLVRVLSAKRGSRARPPVALPAPAPSPVELLPPAPVPTADGGTLKGEYVCMAMFLGSLVGLALM
ncbi:unnamed protein product [Camellia sinensis]